MYTMYVYIRLPSCFLSRKNESINFNWTFQFRELQRGVVRVIYCCRRFPEFPFVQITAVRTIARAFGVYVLTMKTATFSPPSRFEVPHTYYV